jgi:hypothetical protein
VGSGTSRIALAVTALAKNVCRQKSISAEWKSREESMAENVLTKDELKMLFLIMCVVSSDFEATFRERKVDRFALLEKLQKLSGAE